MPRKVEVSHRTIIFASLWILGLWLIFAVRDILLMVFVSLILMAAFKPLVDRLEKLRIPRTVGILVVYLLLWGAIGLGLAGIIPPLVDQTGKLLQLLPAALGSMQIFNNHQQEITQQLLNQIGSLPQNLLHVLMSLFGNVINVFTTLVITFYLLLERQNLDKYLQMLLGDGQPERVLKIVARIESRLGGWVRGELVLMLAVGVMTYVGLWLLGVKITLPLAILAAILEIVPNIGPTISAVPAVLVALTINPIIAASTVALYFVVQILENHFLVPNVMRKAVGVNPLVSVLGLIVGFKLAGPAGAVLAIPLVIVVEAVVVEILARKK